MEDGGFHCAASLCLSAYAAQVDFFFSFYIDRQAILFFELLVLPSPHPLQKSFAVLLGDLLLFRRHKSKAHVLFCNYGSVCTGKLGSVGTTCGKPYYFPDENLPPLVKLPLALGGRANRKSGQCFSGNDMWEKF